MKTTVGQPYSEQTVEDDVRSLYATGLVTNVRIYGEPLPDGVKVIVVVQTRVTLTKMAIQGNEIIKTKRIRHELNLKTGSPLDEQALEQARQKVVEIVPKARLSRTPMFNTRSTSTRSEEPPGSPSQSVRVGKQSSKRSDLSVTQRLRQKGSARR